MADAIVTTDDANFGGGYRQVVSDFFYENVGGTGGPTEMTRLATTTEVPKRWIALRAGSITGVAVKTNDPWTAGTCAVEAYINGAATGLIATLSTTDHTFKAATQAKDLDTFVAGDEISLYFTTSGFTPTTADIRGVLELEC